MSKPAQIQDYPNKDGWYCLTLNLDASTENDTLVLGPYLFTDDTWYDENGDEITIVWDPILQHTVPVTCADKYVLQEALQS